MIDKERVKSKIKIVKQEREYLRDFEGMKYQEFLNTKNIHQYYGAVHHLQVAVQAVLDIAQHIASYQRFRSYTSNKEVFEVLKDNNVIKQTTATSMTIAVGLRNVIVHQYEEVDPEKVYDIIQNHLEDLDMFILEIDKYIQNSQ